MATICAECNGGNSAFGMFTAVMTGFQAAASSWTFLIETLYKAAARRINGARGEVPAPHERIEGLEFLDKV
ncbi:MAG: hypothetical protein R3D32_09725 [Nitratireductor sp.]